MPEASRLVVAGGGSVSTFSAFPRARDLAFDVREAYPAVDEGGQLRAGEQPTRHASAR